MAEVSLNGSAVLNPLQTVLGYNMRPGDPLSYEICKIIYLWHPLGGKIVDAPITLAQSQKREITVPDGPEERCVEQFEAEWKALQADERIANTKRQSRIYGIASIALLIKGAGADKAIDYWKLPDAEITFNVFDPLNTAGSLVLNQDPNAFDFQKHSGITVSGVAYHPSREVTVQNEKPIYIAYTTSSFGFVGRSVYQRALFPLKSFVATMVTDDLVVTKAGLLIAKIKQAGSIITNAMRTFTGQKRALLKEAQTGNVLSVEPDEFIETLNMQNIDGAYGMARNNILKNCATAADMPAVLLMNETLTEGFGEGTEDAKNIAKWVDHFREEMEPLYKFFDRICMHRAWTPEFFETIKKDFPEEYGKVSYTAAFTKWQNSFKAQWPSLLTEPDSEKSKTADVKLKAVISVMEVLMPQVDPANKAKIIEWASDNINEDKFMFSNPLLLDVDALRQFGEDQAAMMGNNGGPPLDGEEQSEEKLQGVEKKAQEEPKPPRPAHLKAI